MLIKLCRHNHRTARAGHSTVERVRPNPVDLTSTETALKCSVSEPRTLTDGRQGSLAVSFSPQTSCRKCPRLRHVSGGLVRPVLQEHARPARAQDAGHGLLNGIAVSPAAAYPHAMTAHTHPAETADTKRQSAFLALVAGTLRGSSGTCEARRRLRCTKASPRALKLDVPASAGWLAALWIF